MDTQGKRCIRLNMQAASITVCHVILCTTLTRFIERHGLYPTVHPPPPPAWHGMLSTISSLICAVLTWCRRHLQCTPLTNSGAGRSSRHASTFSISRSPARAQADRFDVRQCAARAAPANSSAGGSSRHAGLPPPRLSAGPSRSSPTLQLECRWAFSTQEHLLHSARQLQRGQMLSTYQCVPHPVCQFERW
jgi:hypothetical protein